MLAEKMPHYVFADGPFVVLKFVTSYHECVLLEQENTSTPRPVRAAMISELEVRYTHRSTILPRVVVAWSSTTIMWDDSRQNDMPRSVALRHEESLKRFCS